MWQGWEELVSRVGKSGVSKGGSTGSAKMTTQEKTGYSMGRVDSYCSEESVSCKSGKSGGDEGGKDGGGTGGKYAGGEVGSEDADNGGKDGSGEGRNEVRGKGWKNGTDERGTGCDDVNLGGDGNVVLVDEKCRIFRLMSRN